MPASPPLVQIGAIAAPATGWFVDFGGGDTRNVVCWGMLFDNSGAVPLVFDTVSGKLIPALAVKTGYRLIYSAGPTVADAQATLIDSATEPVAGEPFTLGGFYSRKTVYVTASAGARLAVRVEGSADGETWIKFADFSEPGIKTYVELTVHYVRAFLDSVSGGAVTVRIAWSLCGRLRRLLRETGSLLFPKACRNTR